MKLDEIMDLAELRRLIAENYITARDHPRLPYKILNYTPKTQFERQWTTETELSRGLIFDTRDDTIISRSFKKFFNWGEREVVIPDEPFVAYEKMDGCFLAATPLNLWGGGTITIGKVVSEKLSPTLVGVDENGNIVPTQVVDWFNNGTKSKWLSITVDCLPSAKSGSRTGNHLRVTDNHHIYLNGRFRPAIEATTSDTLTTFDTEPAETVLHVFRSGLLGDGSVCLANSQQPKAKYVESHKIAHDPYTSYIASLLGDCAIKTHYAISGHGTQMRRVISRCYRTLAMLRQEWYASGKKQIPRDLSWMDDFSVAKWYMDDGSLMHSMYQQDRASFATNGFAADDVERLSRRLVEMYGVNVSTQASKGLSLRVNAGRDRSIDKMWAAIAPHIHPSMRYKLPETWRCAPFTPYPVGNERYVARHVKIMAIRRLENTKKVFQSGRRGLDIKTTTGNYFVKGVLVHNSLGISYVDADGLPSIATRGSFTSYQAKRATQILRSRYAQTLDAILALGAVTLCFEIILPEYRIVVDYAGREDLVLLAAFDTETGQELDLEEPRVATLGFPLARRFTPSTLDEAHALVESDLFDNGEGVVVRFAGGLRLKLKREEYLRLHRIITGVTPRRIWEMLRDGTPPVGRLFAGTPAAFQEWARVEIARIEDGRAAIEAASQEAYRQIQDTAPEDRKGFALQAQKHRYSAILFKMYDSQPYDEMLWKLTRPGPADPFRWKCERSTRERRGVSAADTAM